ncbi:hypothetical protein D3C80_1825470 [compost metagenome]
MHIAREADLEQLSRSLAAREREILAWEDKILTLEGERDALRRRLEMIEMEAAAGEKALFRACKPDYVYSFG